MPIPGATVTSGTNLTAAELAPTVIQQNAATGSCAAYALKGLTAIQKRGMTATIQAVETDIATARDLVSARQARLGKQKQILQTELNAIQNGNSSIAALYGYAEQAAASCLDVAQGLQFSKEASDFVYTRALEIMYPQSLIASANQELAQQDS